MGLTITPQIFKTYPLIHAGMSLRGRSDKPFGFNLSNSVGDDPDQVRANRQKFARKLGFDSERLILQQQVHGDRIVRVEKNYQPGESDALVTDIPGLLLAVSVADCVPLLLSDPANSVVAAVHSGWRGSAQNIAAKTVDSLSDWFSLSAGNLVAWIGPSAGQCCYEVGSDVSEAFNSRHSRDIGGGKFLFDNRGVVLEQLLSTGLEAGKIEVDMRCTICDERFQSWRREGKKSGRMLAAIGMEAT